MLYIKHVVELRQHKRRRTSNETRGHVGNVEDKDAAAREVSRNQMLSKFSWSTSCSRNQWILPPSAGSTIGDAITTDIRPSRAMSSHAERQMRRFSDLSLQLGVQFYWSGESTPGSSRRRTCCGLRPVRSPTRVVSWLQPSNENSPTNARMCVLKSSKRRA